MDQGEALLARDTRDHAILHGGIVRHGNDHRAGSGGIVGVSDVDRNARNAHGEDRVLMKHRSAHVGKLAKLSVGDHVDGARIRNASGVCHQETRNVGPVLIHIGAHRSCHDGARDIGSAAGEGLDSAVGHGAVEAGDNGSIAVGKNSAKFFIRVFSVKGAIFLEENARCRIHEGVFQIGGKDLTVQVFSAACHVVATCMVRDGDADHGELLIHGELQSQLLHDAVVALLDLIEHGREVFPIGSQLIATVQKIRHLIVAAETLAGRGRNHVALPCLCANDLRDLAELIGICQGAAAEFQNFNHELIPLSDSIIDNGKNYNIPILAQSLRFVKFFFIGMPMFFAQKFRPFFVILPKNLPPPPLLFPFHALRLKILQKNLFFFAKPLAFLK